MIRRYRLASSLILSCVCLMMLSGCAMRNAHYKSFLDLRDETSKNYSQQVVDAIVGVREDGTLPVFFSVEAGSSSWAPTISGGLSSVMAPPWNTLRTQLSQSANASESMSSAIQFNDFGSAPMSRVNTLYALLCFDYNIGDIQLPNGLLYTVVSEQDDADGLRFARKLKNGNYIGVPDEKREEFLKFAKDVNFWTRHAAPDPKDLNSAAGMVYRFSVEYPESIVALAQALKAKEGAEAGLPAAQQALSAIMADYNKLVDEAKTTKANPQVMTTLLTFKREEVQSKAQGAGAVGALIAQSQAAIASNTNNLEGLLKGLRSTLDQVKATDPNAGGIDVTMTINGLNEQITSVMSGDEELIKQFEESTFGGALNAQDSVDKLYRDRFESLPTRFDQASQAQE
ncbi:MAG: hypothetical protein P9L94_00270 [Candidatus Hinthialibacter antarcticus]|nr:hypothetical protein [Candidatus Hinthialibacter antarcticus]